MRLLSRMPARTSRRTSLICPAVSRRAPPSTKSLNTSKRQSPSISNRSESTAKKFLHPHHAPAPFKSHRRDSDLRFLWGIPIARAEIRCCPIRSSLPGQRHGIRDKGPHTRHVQGSKWNCAVGDPVCASCLADAGTVVPVPDAEGCAEVLGGCNSFGAKD